MNALPVAYIRRSVARRGDPGDVSRDSQIDKVRSLANGDGPSLRIMDGDWGISADREKTHKRLAFLELMASVERGEVSAIYAFALDRLARSVQWSARLLDACEDAGTVIITGEGRFDPKDDRDRQMLHFYAMQNEGALRAMKRKAEASVKTRERRGDKIGQRPYGELRTRKDGTVAGADEDAALIVATFREAGSYFAAARLLNDRKVATRSGRPWYPRTVQRIVNRQDSATIPLGHRRGVRSLGSRPLSGLLICHCGAVMGQTTSHWSPKYRCPNGVSNPDHERPYMISEARILPAVMEEAGHLRPSQWRVQGDTDAAEITRLAKRRDDVIDFALDRSIDKAERDRRLAEIDVALAELRARAQADAMLSLVPDAIDWTAPPAVVNEALQALWSGIKLGPDLMPIAYGWRRPEWRK